jgi:16S rRNA (cytidine1402-2'-O)-methyltransferase
MIGTLFLVATPIGNLQDISFRALETLRTVELIACEDTRQTRKLLNHFGISKKLVSYHEHNEASRASELQKLLNEGKSIAVVTDAGTPAIADPAFRAVEKAVEAGAKIVSVPGAAAFVNALIISGLPTDAHFFAGFLPAKSGERRKRLAEIKNIPATLIFYEAPHRLKKSLADCVAVLGNRRAAIVRELTKIYEETVRGTLPELAEKYSQIQARGEIVLVIDRAESRNPKSEIQNLKSLSERVNELEKGGLDRRAALKQAAKEFSLTRAQAYRQLAAQKNSKQRSSRK